MTFEPGEIISYREMCSEEDLTLQRGMNYRPHAGYSIFLMSRQPSAPYADAVEDEGRVLIYEGHDAPNRRGGPDPKTIDQPDRAASGRLTENGIFRDAALKHRSGGPTEPIRVYEKLRQGVWVYNGLFRLVDAIEDREMGRRVFKFRLEMAGDQQVGERLPAESALDHVRMIPSHVKAEVFKRDSGRCVECGAQDNLHFDHIIPFSKGGSSLTASNVQLMCARHNLAKRDRIQ